MEILNRLKLYSTENEFETEQSQLEHHWAAYVTTDDIMHYCESYVISTTWDLILEYEPIVNATSTASDIIWKLIQVQHYSDSKTSSIIHSTGVTNVTYAKNTSTIQTKTNTGTITKGVPNIPESEVTKSWVIVQNTIRIYTIKFVDDDESVIDEDKYIEDSDVTIPSTPSKTGYDFTGWEPEVSLKAVADVTYKATYTIKKCTIKFITEDNTIIFEKQYPYGDVIDIPTAPYKENYVFKQWQPSVSLVATEDSIYTAIYEGKSCFIRFENDDGGYIMEYTIPYGKTIIVPLSPSKEGYDFIAWSPSIVTTVIADATYRAIYKAKTYLVKFINDDDSLLLRCEYNYGDTIDLPSIPYKAGYDFAAWIPNIVTTVVADATYKASYSKKNYTVKFVDDDGTLITQKVYNYKDTIDIPSTPIKEGYTFIDWCPCVKELAEEDAIYTATYQINNYLIVFKNADDSLIYKGIYSYGDTIDIPTNPTKEGYNFTGWNPVVSTTAVADKTYTATYTIKSYTIKFVDEDGTVITSKQYYHGSVIDVPNDPTKEGWKFNGWTPSVNPTAIADATYTATYTTEQFTIKFLDDDGKIIYERQYAPNATIIIPANPTKEGYKFTRWSPTVNPLAVADATYTATYKVNTHGLKFTALEPSTLRLNKNGSPNDIVLYKSTDDETWESWDMSEITLNTNESVFILGDNLFGLSKNDNNYYSFGMTGKISCEGNVLSLLGDDILRVMGDYCFYGLFYYCSSLITAPELPATKLTPYCYYRMFARCTSLIEPPKLPATTLSVGCYQTMFASCSSMVYPPELPATILTDNCYAYMFQGCTSLAVAPELPALIATKDCYWAMFYGCTSLTVPPELPATTLAYECYSDMFRECTALTTTPELPALKTADYCYCRMFWMCYNLTTTMQVLPSSDVKRESYYAMFCECTSLVTAPEMLATDLGYYGCVKMFSGCTSLVNAPEILATDMGAASCFDMFRGCSSLTYLKCNALTFGSYAVTDWLVGVSPTGTFVKNPLATWRKSEAAIPDGWSVVTST